MRKNNVQLKMENGTWVKLPHVQFGFCESCQEDNYVYHSSGLSFKDPLTFLCIDCLEDVLNVITSVHRPKHCQTCDALLLGEKYYEVKTRKNLDCQRCELNNF